MMNLSKTASMRILLAGFLCCATLAALAKSTKLITSWKNPKFTHGNFCKMLVIGMSANPARRADFEDALAASLARSGVEIIPGNTILLRPDASPLDLNYLRMQIREHNIDAVLVSRLVSIKDSVTYVPPTVQYLPAYPYYNSFYGYYGALYPVVYSPGYLIKEKTVRIETNVYAITPPDGELVWTGTSDTFNPKDAQKVIKSVVKLVTEELNRAGVISSAHANILINLHSVYEYDIIDGRLRNLGKVEAVISAAVRSTQPSNASWLRSLSSRSLVTLPDSSPAQTQSKEPDYESNDESNSHF